MDDGLGELMSFQPKCYLLGIRLEWLLLILLNHRLVCGILPACWGSSAILLGDCVICNENLSTLDALLVLSQ